MRLLAVVGAVLVGCASADSVSGDQESAHGDAQAPAPAVEQEVVSVPTDWVPVKAFCSYAFRGPPELMMQAVGAIDSCADGWTTVTCVYRGDYGAFSSDLQEYKQATQYEETYESIDGRAAKLVTAVSDEFLIAAVHFPRVDAEVEGVGLTVWANCGRPGTAGCPASLPNDHVRTLSMNPPATEEGAVPAIESLS